MKLFSFLLTICCTGCQLQEHRNTVATTHIFSQEDPGFYFADVAYKSRADSFELVRIGKQLKFYNAPDLSKSNTDVVRFLYDRAFHEPYLVSLQRNGTLTIATIDTARYQQYETIKVYDSLRNTPVEREVIRVNNKLRYYKRKELYDSAALIKNEFGALVDSLYDLHLRLLSHRFLINDTVTILITTLYTSPVVYDRIIFQLNAIKFWQMPVYGYGGGTDGSSWTLEAKSGNKHHISSNWNMGDRAFENVCKMLLDYVHILPKDIY